MLHTYMMIININMKIININMMIILINMKIININMMIININMKIININMMIVNINMTIININMMIININIMIININMMIINININMVIIMLMLMLIMTIFVMMVIMLLKMMYGINKRALAVKSQIRNLLNLCQINFSSGNLSTISKCEKLAFLDATPNYTFKLNFLHRAHICQQLSTFLCNFHQIKFQYSEMLFCFIFPKFRCYICNFVIFIGPRRS